jgi:L-arabinokinase
VIHERGLADLADPRHAGVNLALLSTVPLGAGVSSSAAVEVAAMVSLLDHFGVDRAALGGLRVAALCQAVENHVVGAPCGIMDQVTSCVGEAGTLLRLVCQPHDLQPPLALPDGVRVIGINSNVKHSVGGGAYGRTRCAAFMGHRIILDRMRQMGEAAGREMTGDPMRGYLANLDPDDYKRFFRPALPEWINGRVFLERHGPTVDPATQVDPAADYPVQHAVDHHVLEARRVRRFVEFLEQAAAVPAADHRLRGSALHRAGHLMYASHVSYTNDAMLGSPECDLLVDLVRKHEHAGLYGAKITGGGSGGTVAVLCDSTDRADGAIAELMAEYERRTGNRPEAFTGTSPGAWQVGSALV